MESHKGVVDDRFKSCSDIHTWQKQSEYKKNEYNTKTTWSRLRAWDQLPAGMRRSQHVHAGATEKSSVLVSQVLHAQVHDGVGDLPNQHFAHAVVHRLYVRARRASARVQCDWAVCWHN
jgi:hypothetical protein